jgi:hypothetical protein
VSEDRSRFGKLLRWIGLGNTARQPPPDPAVKPFEDAERTARELEKKLKETIAALPGECCAHSASCAVHQPPHDAGVVDCTCEEKVARSRHRYIPSARAGADA